MRSGEALAEAVVGHPDRLPSVVSAGFAEKLIQCALVKLAGDLGRSLLSKQCGDAHVHPSRLDKRDLALSTYHCNRPTLDTTYRQERWMLDSLTLDQMRVLIAEAEAGSFSAAARTPARPRAVSGGPGDAGAGRPCV